MRLAALIFFLLAACTSSEDRAAKEQLVSRDESRPPPAPATFDRFRPETALRIGAEEAAARLGSFEWTATVDWTVSDDNDPSSRVQVNEIHRVRQMASGEFDVQSDLDPGKGPGSESGKHVVYAGQMTYARGRYAPLGAFRERPTDRGRDARRYRDESFGLLANLADLFGAALELRPTGDGSLLSRTAKRYQISLGAKLATAPPIVPPAPASPPADSDTQRRLTFLEGRIPVQVSGECWLDAESGVPLKVILRSAFRVKDHPHTRAEVELKAQMRTWGGATPSVTRPQEVLPDERKPKGVARALEAAGFKKRTETETGRAEPGEESE